MIERGRAKLRITVAFALVLILPMRSSVLIPAPLHQDAYVWQRHWTLALRDALTSSRDLVHRWRVLVAETNAQGNLVAFDVDWGSLAATHRPVIAVVRIDGALKAWSEAKLLAQIRDLIADWKTHRRQIAGLEIDFDCGTERLRRYAQFLTALRNTPGVPRPLSITALPAWMDAPALAAVLASVDEVVLQVHAVRAPEEGLFESERALGWINAFAQLTTKPFHVAVPDYGVRTVWDDGGQLLSVEGEMPRLSGGVQAHELTALPNDVADLLGALRRSPPPHFSGIVWFRLPTAQDARTWSLETWRAVVQGDALTRDLRVVAHAGNPPGLTNIVLENHGRIDAEIPEHVALPSGCRLADGVNGYALQRRGENYSLERLQLALLQAHHARIVGWMRCAPSKGTFDEEP